MNSEGDNQVDDKQWLSAHLFLESGLYESPCDHVVVQVVAPAMAEFLKNAWIDRFFFVRYGENGPHIRLRLHGNAATLRAHVGPAITERMAGLHGNTSGIRDIRWIAYEPEIERYGGPHALLVAEEFFHQSSAAACRWLSGLNDANRNSRLGRGLLAMVSLAHATTSDASTAIAFLNGYGRSYLQRFVSDASVRASWGKAMDGAYAAQATQLSQFVSQTWVHLENRDEIGGIIGEYANAAHETMRRLYDLHAMGRVYARNSTIQNWPASARFIASSLMHMTSNRLGITIQEEVHLSNLAARALSAARSLRTEFA